MEDLWIITSFYHTEDCTQYYKQLVQRYMINFFIVAVFSLFRDRLRRKVFIFFIIILIPFNNLNISVASEVS